LKIFAALRFRNYRYWFIGQLASLVGTWMQVTAQGYLVFQLTHSPVFLGYVGFASGAPSILTLVGGVVSDRFPRKTVLIVTQIVMMVLAFILSLLTFTGNISAWHIVGLAFLLGIANAFDAPARQSIVLDLVDKEHLTNAIAMNSSMFNAARAIGPAIAGITYAGLGPAWCFLLNGFSFLAVIIALVFIRIPKIKKNSLSQSTFHDLKEGIAFSFHNPFIRILLLIIFVSSIFGLGYVTLIPAWAVNILKGDASTVGYMQASQGLGSLAGALAIAFLGNFKYRGKLFMLGLLSFPCMLFLFAATRLLPLALLVLFVGGFGFMIVFNLANAILQELVPDTLRGRVMSVYTLGFLGAMPIGALFIGTIAEYTSEPFAIVISAGLMSLFVIWLWFFHSEIRKIK
jgi:MFS family permease